MALPEVHADTPSPGQISWDSFSIKYGSESFSIPGGSTALKWVWWRWNGGGTNSVLEAGAARPEDLTEDDLVLLCNRNGLPVRIQSSNYVDGELLVDGSILATAIATDAITAEKVAANAIVAENIAANAITTDKIDTGAVTAEEISTGYIYSNVIDAEQITGTNISADLTISGRFKTSETGQRVEISSEGLTQYGEDDVVRVQFPNDPLLSPMIDGQLIADSLTVKDGMELRGVQNIFSVGSVVKMQTSIVASAAKPSLSAVYPTSALGEVQWLSPILGYWIDTAESRSRKVTSFFSACEMRNGTTKYERPTAMRPGQTSGDPVPDYSLKTMVPVVVGGAERMVTLANYTVGSSSFLNDTYKLTSWDDNSMLANGSVAPTKKAEISDGTFSWFLQWKLGRCFSASGSARANQFCQAKMNVFGSYPSRPIELKTFTVTDSAITVGLTRNLSDNAFMQPEENLLGVTFGSSARMGFAGTDEDVWVIHGSVKNYVFKDGATLVRQFAREFPAIAASRSVGAGGNLTTNDFTAFYAVPDSDGPDVPKYTNITWGVAENSKWWGAFTWYDSNGTTHETPMSSLSSLGMKQRAALSVTVPQLPDPIAGKGQPRGLDDVNSFRFYLSRETTPSRTTMCKQTDPVVDSTTLISSTQVLYTSVNFNITTVPPTSTTFPAQTASSIESTAVGTGGLPQIKLTGDGFAHFEALDVGGEGAASLSGKAFEQLFYSVRAQSQLSGGGIKTVSSNWRVKWSDAFSTRSLGRGTNLGTDGYFNITDPGTGISITGYGGASSQVTNSEGILLNAWETLWYEVPYGSGFNSQTGKFRVTGYTSDFVVPNNWIKIASRNHTTALIEWATGEVVPVDSDSSIYNIGGQRIKKFNIARGSGTVAGGSGKVTYTHGLGTTPTQVVVGPSGTGNGANRIASVSEADFTSTTFAVQWRVSTTNSLTSDGTACACTFLAIAD